jgi:very-short-patch-repair endonuclease
MRSGLEEEFLRLCIQHRLPLPKTNAKVGRWEVDFLWRSERLVVETDSFAYHRGSVSFEDDHARDLDLRSRGALSPTSRGRSGAPRERLVEWSPDDR